MTVTTQLDPTLFYDEPEPRPVQYTLISVDDHLVEPPGMFEGRLPARWQDQAPRVVETPEGHQVWEFDGNRYTQVGMNAVAGRRPETVAVEPFRFDQMRPGCWDIDARIRDMDINGVWASLNFPSQITGFCGRVFSVAKEAELGVADHARLERLAVRGVVLPVPRRASSRSASRTWPTPRRGPGRSAATRRAASRRWPCPSGPIASVSRRSSTSTGSRSLRRAPRPRR